MRDSLATLASDLIRSQLGTEIQVRAQRADTRNEAAWLLVQRGAAAQRAAVTAFGKGDSAASAGAFRSADSLFAAAASADPTWAVPVTQRATQAYRRSRMVGSDPAQIRPWIDQGLQFADEALALDPGSADALETRGELRYWAWLSNLDVDPAKRAAALAAAKADLEKSTDLDHNQAGAYATLSHLYNNDPKNTTNDVYVAARQALDADEFLSNANVVLYRLFLATYDLGQIDKADQYCRDFGKRFPSDSRSMRCQLYLLTAPRPTPPDIGRAWALADSLAALEPPKTRARETLIGHMLVAATIARASRATPALADSARHVAHKSEGDAAVDATRELAFRGAFVFTILGDKDDAFRLLKDYLAANPSRASSIAADPGWWFRDLTGDPRFARIVGGGR